ncbi:MAG: CDP-diacylglycerol--serine O-phosphatidyltransferase [Deltaproteobacteria bacterium]|nr:CDP-diacylglycerol--serine O-phosphatidyltransferase [Deltaproteobacteria bacterium]
MRAEKRKSKIALLHDGVPRRGIYLLPNLITSAGLFCGIFSIVQTMQGSYTNAALAILAAHIFDSLDGRVARMTNSTSRFGTEYDSLCDLVSFGVAPGVLIYRWALIPWGVWGWSAIGLYVICSAIRLARFNILVGRIDPGYFMGLPVPGSATMLASVVLMYRYVGRSGLPPKQIALLLLTYALAFLMVSSIRYTSFKNLHLHGRQPLSTFILAVLLLSVAVAAYPLFIFVVISLYVLSGPTLAVRDWWRPTASMAGPSVEEEDPE